MSTNRKDLLKVLQLVRPGLASREIIEQSTSFIFTKEQVIAYNDEISVSHPIKGLDLEGAVQAKELFALLNKLTDETIELESTDTELIVKGKKAKAGIKLEIKTNIEDTLKALGTPKKWHPVPATLLEAIDFCLFSVGHDMTKAMLTCIYCGGSDIISSDGFRITVYDLGKGKMEPVNLPGVAATALKNYNPTEYSETTGWIHFRTKDEVVFSCRTMSGMFPADKCKEYLINTKGEKYKLPEDLTEALERAGIFSAGQDIKASTDDRIKITLDDGMLTVRGEGQAGWFEESNRVRYKGELLEFEVSPAHLLAILTHTDEVIIGENMLRFEGKNFVHLVRTLAAKKAK